jgi:hypothetical protein
MSLTVETPAWLQLPLGLYGLCGVPRRGRPHHRGGRQTPMLRSLLPSRAGVAAALLALCIPVAISWASTVVTYSSVGQTMVNGQTAANAAAASRDWNCVYRPIGSFFDLAYLNPIGTPQSPTHSNAGSNPYFDPTGTAFLARAWCRNNSGGTVSPVTCQTTTP